MPPVSERPIGLIDSCVVDRTKRSNSTTTDERETSTAPILHLKFKVGEEARLVSRCSKGRAPPLTQSATTLTENAQFLRHGTSHDCSGDDNGNYDDCNVEWSGEEAHHGDNFQRRDIALYFIVRGKLEVNDIISLYASISTTISYILCAVGLFASLIVRMCGCALLKIGSKIEPTRRSVAKRVGKLGRLCKCLLGLSVLVSLVASEEVSGGISVAEEGRKLAVTLSGSNTGQCAVDGNCFSSLDYDSDEMCTFTMGEDGVLNVISFETESDYDMLTVGESEYSGMNGPQGISVFAGDEITWYSDESETRAGFEICVAVADPCAASSTPSDDGSDGNFYCINGGDVGGWWDEDGSSCTCTCNTGLGGPNCAICATGYSGTPPDDCSPNLCQATLTSTDDGSDGNFYCINGGDIGGTTGSCTCSSCKTGFSGRSCESTIHHVVNMLNLFNTVSNAYNEYTDYTGSSIMANGDTMILAVRLYKGSEGTCASSEDMLYTEDLNGEVKCVEDNASCVLDGENARRVMYVYGTGSGTLILRALTFNKGYADTGGGVYVAWGAILDLELLVFSNNRATDSEWGGGAISVDGSVNTVNVYGTRFIGNTADSGDGDDIYNYYGTITIHNMCPSPYSSSTPIQGKMRMRIV
jgi:predicted outer membrane repeat protein